ncbi:tetraspanin-2 isoform X1 [Choloepus didactylus]|uniref:tetraspanin-2 isoform X1 n=1 Tax=Choloepus didactylus TaxID=27675 RepID=UPI00189FD67F|nr:tetraspanin-2 isoform X1 [Choloepus didactylus]
MWPRGRVSLEPVTSSTVCLVAAGLGLMPLSTDFALYLETLSFHQVAAERRMCKAGGEALPGTAGPGHLHLQLAGSAVIAFGLWFRFGGTIKDLSSEDKSPEYFYVGLYVLVGAGALMMAVGFCGCCGAMRESQCILGSFFTCLLVIFAAEVTTGVFAFIGKGIAIRHVQTIYEEAYNDYLKDRGKGNGTLITFHSTFQCCGKESSEQVQPTCPKELLGHKNCINEIETAISIKLQLIGIVGIGVAGLTIFGMIFSMVLCCAIRNSRDMI